MSAGCASVYTRRVNITWAFGFRSAYGTAGDVDTAISSGAGGGATTVQHPLIAESGVPGGAFAMVNALALRSRLSYFAYPAGNCHPERSAVRLVAPLKKNSQFVALFGFHPDTSASKAEHPLQKPLASCTELMSHPLMSWLNEAHPASMLFMSVTCPVFQDDMSWLKSDGTAPLQRSMWPKFVIALTSQSFITHSAPTHPDSSHAFTAAVTSVFEVKARFEPREALSSVYVTTSAMTTSSTVMSGSAGCTVTATTCLKTALASAVNDPRSYPVRITVCSTYCAPFDSARSSSNSAAAFSSSFSSSFVSSPPVVMLARVISASVAASSASASCFSRVSTSSSSTGS
mmetsp:Transcript_9260/g.34559  ORF Transcript_9260/g.34559 Transcript_9260/m.34559 type:complete len:345 (-) Transcript_9260:2585-3619(-)